MKNAIQALLIANDMYMRLNILKGDIRISIREGHRDYIVGRELVIFDNITVWSVLADIIEVKHCSLSEITQEEWEADGFTSQENLLEGMREYYPSLTLDSPVTVIRWDNVRGSLVDNYYRDLENMRTRNR